MQVDADAGVFDPGVGVVGMGAEDIAYGIGVGMGRTTAGVVHAVAALGQADDVGGEDASGVEGRIEVDGDSGVFGETSAGVGLVEVDGGEGVAVGHGVGVECSHRD